MKKLILLVQVCFIFSIKSVLFAQILTDSISLTGISYGSATWGDYDNDGDLDVFMSGSGSGSTSKIYQNNSGSFSDITNSLIYASASSITPGDYDNDGDIDILLTGSWKSLIYRNESNIFNVQSQILLEGVTSCSSSWGDYDNDGDLDILITGNSTVGKISRIYRNNSNNSFTEQTDIILKGVTSSAAAWGDYDNDGNLDIIIAGESDSGGISVIYRNNGDNSFTEQTDIELKGVYTGSVAWGDYDNDGNLDILLTGNSDLGRVSTVYHNNGNNSFTEQSVNLPPVSNSSAVWGDIDNDGDLDILITGNTGTSYISRVYSNTGNNTFTHLTSMIMSGVYNSSVALGDFDNDRDLDILLTGNTTTTRISKIYRNGVVASNNTPSTPAGLMSTVNTGVVALSWNKSTDSQTLSEGINYNIYLYESGQTTYKAAPHAFRLSDPKNGLRLVSKIGNIRWKSGGYLIKNLPPDKTYYWTVQALDASMQGSPFSTEISFSVPFYRPYTQANCISFSNIQATQVTASWATGGGTARAVFIKSAKNGTADPADNVTYNIDDTTPGGWKCIYNGTGNTVNLTGLIPNTDYLLHVCEYNGTPGNEKYLVSSDYENPARIVNTVFIEQPGITFTGVFNGSAACGDYNNDGSLDIVLAGATGSFPMYSAFTKIYSNNGDNSFSPQSITMSNVAYSSVKWSDFDSDGDLDVLLTGSVSLSASGSISKIYINNGSNTFSELTTAGLTGVYKGSVDCGDFDNDGDIDILLTGSTYVDRKISKVYSNNGNLTFSELTNIGLSGVCSGSASWCDYDNDDDLDILLTGLSDSGPVCKIYRNNNDNTFSEQSEIIFTGVSLSSASWGDYDSNGYPDLIISGNDASDQRITKIYHNNGNNTFTERAEIDLTGISSGSVVWGDYDNDGDLDILLTGTADSQASGAISTVYVNNNNSFSEQSTISITGVYNSSVTWIDFDNDNDLDFLITGQDSNDKLVSKVFKNEITVQNVKPEIPANLQATVDSNIVILSWDKATDQQTLQSGLNYNLYIYESGQTTYKRPPLAFRQSDAKNGLRLIESQGNIRWTSDGYQIKNLPPGKTYLWSVQTLDAGLKGSCFSSESSFYVPLYRPAVQAKCLSFSNILATQAKATWANGGGTRRVVFIRAGASGEADPEDNITYNVNDVTPGGWKCVYNGSENFTTITDLVQNTDYYIHVCEYNGDTGSEKYLKTTDYNNPSLLNIIIFTEQTGITLTGVSYSSAAWGNYDNDGDLDILYTGKTVLSEIICRIYRNNGDNTFPDFSTLTGVSYGALAFGDYDNDNDLDIILTGEYKTMINRNDPIGVYTLQPDIVLPAVKYSSTAWGDYDGDGDLDFLLTGETVSNEKISKIYQNNGDLSFNENAASFLVGVSYGSSAWSDYDNDGDLDILLTGLSSSGPVSKIYQNIGDNTFVENDRVKLTGVKNSSVAWGDYDNDGYPDILLTGETETGDKIAKIYRNCGDNTFSVQSINNLSGVSYGSTEWGDFDNDGDLDILLSGNSCSGKITKVFRNLGNNSFYEQISVVLPGTDHGSLAWGDYDNDGDLDILLTGSYGTGSAVLAKVFRNEIPYSNTSPTAPANLQSSLDGEWINFTWNASSDSSTPSSGLLYNLRIGTQTGANNIKSAQSLVTGKLLTPRIINMINGTSFRIKLPVNNYYWSVQAVDRGGLGSSFPGEQTIAADSIQASDLRAFIKTRNSLLVRWENGNGTRRAVFGRLSSSLAPAKPVNGEIYLPEPYFGNGDRIGTSGWYCLYNGKSDSATIYGLNPGYSYDLQVVEYIEIGGLPRYFSTSGQGNPGIFSTSLFSEQTNIVLPDITRSSVAWGDYDNDGDLDILMTGSGITKVYKNDNNNNFIEQSSIVLPDATNGDVTWGDYDNDDDLDILLTGNGVSKIFRNESNAFNPQNDISLLGMSGCTSKWGDYDNDGYLDIMMAGSSGTFPNYIDANKLYHNNGDNTFTEVENNLPPVSSNSLDWGDYDNDGDLDILITGMQGIVPITKIFRNNGGGSFSDEENIILTGVLTGLAEWVDYDNDGDLDIMLTGDDNFMESDSRIISLIYRNNGDNTFTEVSDIIFTGVSLGSFDWGDYDNDGDLDLLLTGDYGALFSYEAISKIYRNDLENGFSELTDISLKAVGLGSVAWGDYDNDGDLDILLTGGPDSGPVTKIYRNNTIMKAGTYVANNKPAAVMNLHSLAQPEGTFLYWAPVCNDETYWKAMSYNIMIGTSANLSDVQSPHSSIINGYRRIADLGNTQSDTSHIVKNLPARKYYWQVQAVDQGFMGGEWSVVDSFEVRNVQAFYSADEVCLGYPTHFTDQSVATEGIASWIWDFKDGTTSTVQNPVHTYSASGTYNVKLVITDIGGIKDSLEQDVIVRPKPLTGFSAPDVCQGIPLTVTNTTNPNGLTVSSWYWDFGDESVPSYNQQPAPHPYLNPGDYDIKLRAEATNGCADSITKTVSVGAYPVAAVTANASLTFCSGGRVTLSVPYDPEYSYTWQVDGVPLTGGNSYSYVAQLTGDYSVKVVNPKGNCTTISSEVSITSLEAPAAPYISKSGSQTFCEGDSVELSVTNTLNYTYQWKKDGGLVGTGYEYHAKSSGGYSLTVKNTEGCSAEATDTVEVVVRDAPSPGNISVSGPSTFCQGGSVTLSVPATTGYTYKWKNEYGEITGATTSSYAATATGIYKLEVMNSTGCGAETTPVTVTVKATPDKPVITSANYSEGICPGENPITLSASSTVPGYRYMWIRNGELQYTDTLSYIEFYEQGIYKLRAALGDCASESDAFNITLPEAPDKPVMYVKGPVVWYMAASTKSAKYYKWYRDGELIQGANKYIYVANKTLGTYKVAVGNENGCYTMSDPRTIPLAKSEMTDFYIPPEYLNRDGKDPFGSLQIYPNPTAGVFTVEMENSISGEIVISVITEQGKEVRNIRSEKTTEHFITEIDLGDEPKGVYFIMLQIDNYLETRKVVLE